MLTGHGIICFANDWKADPLSKKHLMVRLAKHNRILWVNSLHNRQPRLAQKDFRRAAQKLREFFRGVENVHPNIWQVTPLYVPFLRYRWIRRLNRFLLQRQLRYSMWRLGFRQPITWTFTPTSADVVGTLGESLIIYHCVDEFASFRDAAVNDVRQAEERLLKKANVILAASQPLWERKRVVNENTHVFLHGVDYEHIRQATQDSTPVAADLIGLPRPILGFHGLLADWVDVPLLAEVARRRPDWTFVFVGRVETNVDSLRILPNVHLLGHRPYAQLPEYLRAFDVALLPFAEGELTHCANPLKLREYLAAGLPVVATPLPEVVRFSGVVSLATTADEYVREIAALLEQGKVGPSPQRSEKMVNESWDHKMAEIEKLIGPLLPVKDDLQERLQKHPQLRNRELAFVRRSDGRHSQLLEYRPRDRGKWPPIVVKRLTSWGAAGDTEEVVTREFQVLENLSKHPKLRGTVPTPLLLLPKDKALVLEKLPGMPLSAILKRDANRLVGAPRQNRACAAARLAGKWLRQLHDVTRQPPTRHDSDVYLSKFLRQLAQCERAGLDKKAAQRVGAMAARASRSVDGRLVGTAARQGDFIPQNLLVDGNRLAVVDFENFSECSPIYEDLGTFVAYLAMLNGSPFYARATLDSMARNFLSAYGEPISSNLLNLYVVKAAVTVVSEFQSKKWFQGGTRRLRLLHEQLINVSGVLLRDVADHSSGNTLVGDHGQERRTAAK